MSDPTPDTPQVPVTKNPVFSNHAKVSGAVVGGAIASLVISLAEAHGVDLSGQESNITVVVMAAIGYFIKDES